MLQMTKKQSPEDIIRKLQLSFSSTIILRFKLACRTFLNPLQAMNNLGSRPLAAGAIYYANYHRVLAARGHCSDVSVCNKKCIIVLPINTIYIIITNVKVK